MNRFKRIAAMFMVVLTLFSSFATMTVSAATEGKDTTLDTSYRCTKNSNTGIAGTAPIGDSRYYWHYNADGTALNCPVRFMKEKGTDKPAYCIEVGATFNGYTYDTKALTDSPYWNKLSATAQIGITYATMYGYPVNNYGAANCDAYAATQTIIWEFAKGYRDLNGRTNAYYYNLMIKGSPAASAYDQLSADIVAHNKRPSFAYATTSTAAKNEIELKYNATNKNWSATLTDANGVLSGYKVTSNGGLTVSKSGNSLTISTASEISGTAQVQLARPLPTTGQALLALYSTTSQNAIIGQLQDPVNSYMTITTEELFGKRSLARLREKITNLIEMREDGDIDKEFFRKRKGELDAKIDRLEQDIANLSPQTVQPPVTDFASRLDLLKERLREYVNFQDNGVSESVIEAFIEKVWVAKDEFRWYLRSGDGATDDSSERMKIAEFTLTIDDAKAYKYAISTRNRVYNWRDLNVSIWV